MKNELFGKHSPVQAIAPLCLALLLMAIGSPASQALRYHEQTGDNGYTFSWQAEQEQESGTITVIQHQDSETFSSVNTAEGATRSWHYVNQPDTNVQAERNGDSIRLSGRFKGKEIDVQRIIDSRPWYQPLSYCLQRMVARNQQAASYWTIRPDTLEVLAMRAEKKGSERISLENGSLQMADKVVINLEGVMSALWEAEYWFRHGDNVFLQYRGTHGPPGTAETKVCLINP